MSEALIIDACRTPRGIGKLGKGALAHLHPQRLAASVLGRDRRAQRPRHVEGRRHHLGHQQPVGHAGRRPRPHGAPSTPATTSRRAASRSTASAAAASLVEPRRRHDRLRAGGHRHRRRHRDDVDLRRRTACPVCRRSWTPATPHLRAIHPQPHQGVCADAIATLEGIPREALDDLAFESQQRAATRDRGGPLRAQPHPRAQRRRHRRPRPRGVPAPADDPRGPRRLWRPRSPACTTSRSTKRARRSSR